MSIISRIKAIQPAFEINPSYLKVRATAFYNGQQYIGETWCCPKDIDFFSPRIGKRIARMRLYLNILNSERQKAKAEWLGKQRYYTEVLAFGEKNPAEIDPSGAFKRNLERAAARYKKLDATYKIVAQNLNNYLASLKKSHAIVQDYRDKLVRND